MPAVAHLVAKETGEQNKGKSTMVLRQMAAREASRIKEKRKFKGKRTCGNTLGTFFWGDGVLKREDVDNRSN